MSPSRPEDRILVRAPSNIAIVKYMGKIESPDARNLPENPSVSLTLSQLCTFVELRIEPRGDSPAPGGNRATGLRWVAEPPQGVKGDSPRLDEKGVEKFLRHARRVLFLAPDFLDAAGVESEKTGLEPDLEIRTSNTFPHAAGIASSASSFAALTLAMLVHCSRDREAFRRKFRKDPAFRASIAGISREGSGSSCRSFDGPFVSWEGERVRVIPSKLPPLSDLVVVVSSGEKKVGSSEAHRRVKSSPLWLGRRDRATERHSEVIRSIGAGDFMKFAEIAEADSTDMHRLFETSEESFSYAAPGTRAVLEFVEQLRTRGVPSIHAALTMDAGPNVHVLVPSSEEEFVRRELVARFPEFPILVDREGTGAEILEIGAPVPSRSNWTSYSVSVPGKWVLSGEHTVLRGGRAIALPHPDFALKLDFRPSDRNLEVAPDLAALAIQELLRLARDWLAKRGTRMEMPRGSLRIQSTIPFSAGLGSSAALSVATARWVLSAHSLDRSLERELAREMEDRFHGKSSGMDVAAVSIGEPILFSMRDGAISLGIRHLPKFAFFDSGLRAATRECIERVEKIRAGSERGEELDRRMSGATDRILEGLREFDEATDRKDRSRVEEALKKIEAGMIETREIYEAWGLIPEEVRAEIVRLERQGVRAPRLTGAGGGGFLVGLRKT